MKKIILIILFVALAFNISISTNDTNMTSHKTIKHTQLNVSMVDVQQMEDEIGHFH